ncbi:MAG: hypothetical protein IPP48_10555 [Chitinophagaceae bacterium]|nr:hypothetical protein [Chitinophagaceae bacterium]
MLDKLFGWGKKKQETNPSIRFGRYSDNNKTVEKTNKWTEADNLFKEKKYHQSIDAFFDYLRDDEADNVKLHRNGSDFSFEIYQGSKIVRGKGDNDHLYAEVSLANMPQLSVPVMRRLLDQNFTLYYSRYALDNERLCMRFDSDIETANPNKLYYALKELSTKADKQDDLLVQDFTSLQMVDTEHVDEIPESEKETKYAFTQKWISEALAYLETLDAEKFSGGIAYLLLTLVFKIDYLVCPEGKLQAELEKIPHIYFAKDEKPAVEKNNAMMEAFKKFQSFPKEDFFKNLFNSKSSFAIVTPQTHKTIADVIYGANNNMIWYRDNNYPFIAQQICEYGISFCQYSYSLPKPLTQLFQLFMQVNYPDYFMSLGFTEELYNAEKNKFSSEEIINKINTIQTNWRKKYPKLDFKTANLRFDNLVNFNNTYTNELEFLNFDTI